jgi:hypothetical protein
LGDTYTPINPDTFAWRLEAAGFAEVVVERGCRRFRFRATRPARSGTSYRAEPGAAPSVGPAAPIGNSGAVEGRPSVS